MPVIDLQKYYSPQRRSKWLGYRTISLFSQMKIVAPTCLLLYKETEIWCVLLSCHAHKVTLLSDSVNCWRQLIFLKCSLALSRLVWFCLFGTFFLFGSCLPSSFILVTFKKHCMVHRIRYLFFPLSALVERIPHHFSPQCHFWSRHSLALTAHSCLQDPPLFVSIHQRNGAWEIQLVSWIHSSEVTWSHKCRVEAGSSTSFNWHGRSENCHRNVHWEVKNSFYAFQE